MQEKKLMPRLLMISLKVNMQRLKYTVPKTDYWFIILIKYDDIPFWKLHLGTVTPELKADVSHWFYLRSFFHSSDRGRRMVPLEIFKNDLVKDWRWRKETWDCFCCLQLILKVLCSDLLDYFTVWFWVVREPQICFFSTFSLLSFSFLVYVSTRAKHGFCPMKNFPFERKNIMNLKTTKIIGMYTVHRGLIHSTPIKKNATFTKYWSN